MDAIYDKLTGNVLNGERLKDFSLRTGTWQWCPPSTCLLDIESEALAREICQLKEIKVIQIRQEREKLSPFSDATI